MTDDAVRRLLAESDVQAQLGRAARLLDGKRWDALEEVFDPEITFDYGDGAGVQRGLDLHREVRWLVLSGNPAVVGW